MAKPGDPLTEEDKLVYGANAQRHVITGMVLEQGSGALPPDQQAQLQCAVIEQREGKAAANAMRKKLADAKQYAIDAAKLAADKVIIAADGVTPAAAIAAPR